MKRARFYLGAAIVSLSCFVGIPMMFIGEDFMGDLVANVLDLKVSPGFTGGILARNFIDEIEDDKNLQEYKVYQPVYDAVWQQNPDYWQIEQRYDSDARNLGSINVILSDDSGNEYILSIGENKTVLMDQNGNSVCDCENYFMENGKLIKTRIPLKEKKLHKFYITENTKHTVYVEDEIQLSKNVDMKSREMKKNMRESIDKIKDAYYEMKDAIPFDEHKTGNEDFDKAYFFFWDGENEKAEPLFKALVEKNDRDAVANAYYGSCLAIRGGKSNVFSAMGLVKKSYIHLDKAVELSQGQTCEVDCLMNRAEVSVSVPNAVFGKAEQGALDFARCAELFVERSAGSIMSEEDKLIIAYCHASAAECYLNCKKESEAALSLKKAEKMLAL
ncbi:MAG: hypothetical protein MST12_05180 [Spirochaetia bacterium]|uniref:hypothetical protein n=1 Tax=Treponema sp. TaxID=166 RepID=UPI00298E0C4B|nr:hypothetical protein [Treponema sp.]MCI7396964.1 hypothetical protein [Spirochaetia bacterium]MCI7577629.1 hypothetical protein [Spirochaetia bacterium]